MKIIKEKLLLVLMACAVVFAISCTKEVQTASKPSSNPIAASTQPALASSNTLITVTGSGLGAIRTIVFSNGNVPAAFNPVLNTDEAILFRVPTEALPGKQDIIVTNADGVKLTIPFTVLGLPTITDVSNYNFTSGGQITLTGKNLDDVTKVVLNGTGTEVTVVSKTATQLVLKFPSTTLNYAKLDITNAAGKVMTTQEFVNIDNAFQIYTDDYQNGFQDASWGDPGVKSTTVFKSGTAALGKKFAAGNWSQFGFGWNNTSNNNYKYLSFWVRGGSKSYNLWISSASSEGGFASFNEYAKVAVPANVWTYYKIPVDQLQLWKTGTTFNQLGWRIQGPDGADETIYLDDVIFIKAQ